MYLLEMYLTKLYLSIIVLYWKVDLALATWTLLSLLNNLINLKGNDDDVCNLKFPLIRVYYTECIIQWMRGNSRHRCRIVLVEYCYPEGSLAPGLPFTSLSCLSGQKSRHQGVLLLSFSQSGIVCLDMWPSLNSCCTRRSNEASQLLCF